MIKAMIEAWNFMKSKGLADEVSARAEEATTSGRMLQQEEEDGRGRGDQPCRYGLDGWNKLRRGLV